MGRGFGITALIFGIISIPFTVVLGFLQMWIFFEPNLISIDIILGWLIPGIAIIFGIIGIILDSSKGMAIAGLILGIIGGYYIHQRLSAIEAKLQTISSLNSLPIHLVHRQYPN